MKLAQLASRPGPGRGISLGPGGAGLILLVFPGWVVAFASGQSSLIGLCATTSILLFIETALADRWARVVRFRAIGARPVTQGETVTITLRSSLALGSRRLRGSLLVRILVGVDTRDEWLSVPVPSDNFDVDVVMANPGVFSGLSTVVAVGGPLGLLAVRRKVTIECDEPLSVVPPPIPTTVPNLRTLAGSATADIGAALARNGHGSAKGWAVGEDVAGFRRYRPGDRLADVSWQALARTGMLIVAERERVTEHGLVTIAVVVDLRSDDDEETVSRILGQARFIVERIRRSGQKVRLVAWQETLDGGVEARDISVVGGDAMLRQLAAAVVSPTSQGPSASRAENRQGATVVEIDRNGARWLVSQS